jgi:predicted nucleotidyltransferase
MIRGMEAPAAERFLARTVRWAQNREDVLGILLVGSWARGTPRADSDLDLMVVVDDPQEFRQNPRWMNEVDLGLEVSGWRDEDYGAAWSRHVYLEDSSKLEFGFSTREWASINPLDAGTKRVVSEGCRVLYDPQGVLERLLDYVRSNANNSLST